MGIFELPRGCSGHTDDWIFPASFRRHTNTLSINRIAPQLTQIDLSPIPVSSSNRPLEPFTSNRTLQQSIAALLAHNQDGRRRADILGRSISELEEESCKQQGAIGYTSRYPVELGVGVAALTFFVIFLLLERLRVKAQLRLLSAPLRDRIAALEARLTALEQTAEGLDELAENEN